MKAKAQLGSLLLFLALTLVFSLDCFAPIAAESQAMECCGSMPCNHGSSQHDCCKTMQQSPVAMLSVTSASLFTRLAPIGHRAFQAVLSPRVATPALLSIFTGSPGPFDHAPPANSPQSITVLRI